MRLLKRLVRKAAAFSVVAVMMIPSFAVSATYFTDTTGHWAHDVIEKWAKYQILSGFGDGTVHPDDGMTKAQLSVVINKFMKYTLAEKDYADVAWGEWYYDDMMALKDKGIFNVGADNKAYPDKYITREEAVTAIAKAFDITSSLKATTFSDDVQISANAKPYVAAMQAKGYVSGMGDGTFAPQGSFTRAQIFSILDRVVGNYINSSKTYDKLDPGNAVVNVSGAIIKNVSITGDLYITPGVKNGDVTLDNVKVTGRTIIQGGGVNSIHLKNGTKLYGTVAVKNTDRTVRIESDSTSVVEGSIQVTTNVVFDGSYKNITITGKGVGVEVRGKVDSILVEAANAAIVASKGASIGNIIAKGANTTVSGYGEVKTVEAKAKNVVVKTSKTKVVVGSGVMGTLAGDTEVKEGATVITNTEGTGVATAPSETLSSGSGDSGSSTTPNTKPTPTPTPTPDITVPDATVKSSNQFASFGKELVFIKLPGVESKEDAQKYVVTYNGEPVEYNEAIGGYKLEADKLESGNDVLTESDKHKENVTVYFSTSTN